MGVGILNFQGAIDTVSSRLCLLLTVEEPSSEGGVKCYSSFKLQSNAEEVVVIAKMFSYFIEAVMCDCVLMCVSLVLRTAIEQHGYWTILFYHDSQVLSQRE